MYIVDLLNYRHNKIYQLMSIDFSDDLRYTIDWDKVQGHCLPTVKPIIEV